MFKRTISLLIVGLISMVTVSAIAAPPNIVLIMTDDQGYGDLGFTGNPIIKTPNIDRFAEESVVLENFYVCPVCAPTRASLMTGRYNYRTRAIDTYRGRAMMDTDEVTLAEYLGEAGYKTGIFGKWHLGDNYPMRPQDQGFQESLVHRGGGIGQPADPPDNHYMDPVLFHNGEEVQGQGYCSDIFTDAAIDFIRKEKNHPFLVYLPFNCPHTPLEISDEYYLPYKKLNMKWEMFPQYGAPLMGKFDPDETAKVYGMVTNIDMNLGKLFAALKAQGVEENTVVLFITDNGPQQPRYKAGLKGRKGMVYEGGIHVPGFIRWPKSLRGDVKVEQPLAHIDVVPTFLDICGVEPKPDVKLDGRSFKPLLSNPSADWPDRNLYFQWHRGDVPQPFRACAVRGPRYKMTQANGVQEGDGQIEPKFELYDLAEDPYEMNDLSETNPELLATLQSDYEDWFEDVSSSRGYDVPRIHLGAPQDNPTTLTRQDWRGPVAGWREGGWGIWYTTAEKDGDYDFELRFNVTLDQPGTAHLRVGETDHTLDYEAGGETVTFKDIPLEAGNVEVEPWIEHEGKKLGPMYTVVTY
ncbi:MAG: arylsulfatase [Candidatus Omnitrophica bacterium]|nr:arylsulfatase [Candidatus Omnitrophota bacterium]